MNRILTVVMAAVAVCALVSGTTAALEKNWSAVLGWICCVLWIATAFIWQRTAALWRDTARMQQEMHEERMRRPEVVITDWKAGRGWLS